MDVRNINALWDISPPLWNNGQLSNSELIQKYTNGNIGDPTGYEESLYVTENGKYFLYTNGGAESVYPTENITRMSAAKADEWRKNH